MNTELIGLERLLGQAKKPEDVFGQLGGDDEDNNGQARALQVIYRRLSKVAHPDHYIDADDRETAQRAFRLLESWHQAARDKVAFGVYGKSTPPVVIRHRHASYLVQPTEFAYGDVCNLYSCTRTINGRESAAVFKVARRASDNDLVAREAAQLRCLASSPQYDQFGAYVPRLCDALMYHDVSSPVLRRVNVLAFAEGRYFSLREVRQFYSLGIDPKDMAWIWRRLLIALGFAHSCGIIHGAVLPVHILIQPEQHGLVLIDWSYAVNESEIGDHVPAIVTPYRSWYPSEVLAKETPSPGTDLYMGAKCMVSLLGGDPLTGTLPESVPKRLQTFFQGVMLPKSSQRPPDALALVEEFTELIELLWGPRKFHEFSMPKK